MTKRLAGAAVCVLLAVLSGLTVLADDIPWQMSGSTARAAASAKSAAVSNGFDSRLRTWILLDFPFRTKPSGLCLIVR